MRRATFITTLVLLAGCAPLHQMQASFDPAAVERLKQPGSETLIGQGFMRQQGGSVVTCAGETVTLLAGTPYVMETSIAFASGQKLLPEVAQHLHESIVRQTTCDAQGNFAFSNLIPGDYLVGTKVTWMAGNVEQGGPIERPVTVPSGGNKIILSR